jgi:hypothetical protein
MSFACELDQYLLPEIRSQIEQRYYARVNDQAQLDRLAHDGQFLEELEQHIAFYSDHGVVHVRDVAQQILHVLEISHGLLIPARTPNALAWMKGYGVALAYLHDIGMSDFSHFGRAMHPEFAAQAVFGPEFDPLVELLWAENCGNLAWRLLNLANRGLLEQPPMTVLRELLAMAVGHSKSKVPLEALNDPQRLRAVLQRSIGVELTVLYQRQQAARVQPKPILGQDPGQPAGSPPAPNAATRQAQHEECILRRHYADFPREAFAWLVSPHAELCALVDDVVDTLRALRCADALRQRGTVLNTSGGYQIFVDRRTANAIYAFKVGADEMLLLVETANHLNAGEANVASSELTREGDLRISFHRGDFATPAAGHYAVQCAATVVNDIQGDVLSSFQRPAPSATARAPLKDADTMQILLEEVDDNAQFAGLVASELERINPTLRGRCRQAPSLQHISDRERALYLNGVDLNWSLAERRCALARVAATGHKISSMDADQAFQAVKLVTVKAGEVLIEAGSPPGFVYIPLGAGLGGRPLGGYRPFPVYPWMPLGNTGVIRGAVRNATVVADQTVQLLMIPKDVYLNHWHATYTSEEFQARLAEIYTGTEAGSDTPYPETRPKVERASNGRNA